MEFVWVLETGAQEVDDGLGEPACYNSGHDTSLDSRPIGKRGRRFGDMRNPI
jgi:hypothetical protein